MGPFGLGGEESSTAREILLVSRSRVLVSGLLRKQTMQRTRVIRECCAIAILAMLIPVAVLAQQGTQTSAYTIQSGDILEISVWRETELNKEVLVRPDGIFSFPLAGDVTAIGNTVEQIREIIVQNLRIYISDPVVTVTVKQTSGNKVYVLGKVKEPGEYVLNRPVDVMQALSMAGGTITFAALNDIRILRRDRGKQIAIPFRYSEVEKGVNLEQNIMLMAGDIVVVP